MRPHLLLPLPREAGVFSARKSRLDVSAPTIPRSHDGHMARHQLSTYLLARYELQVQDAAAGAAGAGADESASPAIHGPLRDAVRDARGRSTGVQHSSRIRILRILRISKNSRILTNFKTANEFYYFILITL